MQGVQRYLIFAYIIAGVLLWAILSRLLGAIAYAVNAPDAALIGANFTVTSLIGLLLAAGSVVYAFKNERVYNFSSEVVGELKKVTWPSKKETQSATVVVIVASSIMAAIIFFYDVVWSWATGIIYR